MSLRKYLVAASMLMASASTAQNTKTFDAAAAFGARPTVADLSLSPDGLSVAYVAPTAGQGSALFTVDLAQGAKSRIAMLANGKPERIEKCHWVSNERLVCSTFGVVRSALGLMTYTRIMSVDRSGGNLKVLSTQANEHTQGWLFHGGEVIDWLPDEDSSVLMSRLYVPDEHLGSHIGSRSEGLGVDSLDTRNLNIKSLEVPAKNAFTYITDGRGAVRIVGRAAPRLAGQDSGVVSYHYRTQGSREWQKLGD